MIKIPYAVHVARPITRPNDADLAEIAEILNNSENVVLYGGSGCQGAHQGFFAVADKLKAPIAHTSRAKDFLEYDNPYNIGMTGILGNEAGYHALLDCDALLMLGADFAWRQFYPDKAKIVQVDIDPTHLGRRHPVTKGVVGDVKATMEALLPMLAERTDASFRSAYVKRYAKYREAGTYQDRAGHDWQHSRKHLTQVINRHAAKDALLTADDGTAAAWAYRHIEANGQRRLFGVCFMERWPTVCRRRLAAEGRTRPASGLHGGRRRNFDAIRRPDDGRRSGAADQDCCL